MFFKKLPKWIPPTTQQAFNDKENGTAIEMVSRIYKKMNDVIDSYNQFADDITNSNNVFQEELTEKIETYATSFRQEFQDFIDVVNLAIDSNKQEALQEIEEKLEQKSAELRAYLQTLIPDVPTKLSELTNDKGYITLEEVPEADVPTKLSELENDAGFITLPDVPTKVSELTNDKGYITLEEVPEPDIPTKISELTNDKGYITLEEVPEVDVPTKTETWTFTLEDGSTVTKAVYVG